MEAEVQSWRHRLISARYADEHLLILQCYTEIVAV